MHGGAMVMGGAAFVLLGFVLVGGPVFMVDWFRKRREMAIERQIALTDALDEQLGTIVAPVVTRRLFGPWEIRIGVPYLQSPAMARVLSVVDDQFSDVAGKGSSSYRIILTAAPSLLRGTQPLRTLRPMKRWARRPLAAA